MRDMDTHTGFSNFLILLGGAGFCVRQIAAANIVIFYVCRISLYNGELWTHLKKEREDRNGLLLSSCPSIKGYFRLSAMKANLWTHKKRVTGSLNVA